MKRLTYAMVIEPGRDKRGKRYYCAYFPDLPGCATMGNDKRHLKLMAREAIEGYLQVTRDHGEQVPLPTSEVGMVTVDAPAANGAVERIRRPTPPRRAAPLPRKTARGGT
jgi:predicted RNase H-like HicB family nuclease